MSLFKRPPTLAPAAKPPFPFKLEPPPRCLGLGLPVVFPAHCWPHAAPARIAVLEADLQRAKADRESAVAEERAKARSRGLHGTAEAASRSQAV